MQDNTKTVQFQERHLIHCVNWWVHTS